MAPDSWLASEAAAKLARGVGDRRTEALALCIAARQAVPLCGALLKREWDMAHNNDWEWKTQLPELGYFDSSHVNATRWDDSQLSASGIVGMIPLSRPAANVPGVLTGGAARFSRTDGGGVSAVGRLEVRPAR